MAEEANRAGKRMLRKSVIVQIIDKIRYISKFSTAGLQNNLPSLLIRIYYEERRRYKTHTKISLLSFFLFSLL
jgi:hypothetical protein